MTDFFLNQALEFELKGETITRYTPHLGDWMWMKKKKWSKMTVEEHAELRHIHAFDEMRTTNPRFEHQEWKRMHALCLEFEQKNPTALIVPRQTYKSNPIGRWISAERRHVIDKTAYAPFLLMLRTITEWNRTRDPTWQEKAAKQMEEIRIHLEREKARQAREQENKKRGEFTQSDADILQVHPSASIEVIKAAYKALGLKKHPDKGGSTKEFQQLQGAYERMLAKAK